MSTSVAIQLDRNKISRDKDYEGHLMVSISSKDENFKRTPVQAILVVDVSGSMAGEKIQSVRQTANKIVENLTSQDEIAIVTFTDVTEVILPRQKVTSKESIYAAISRIKDHGSTNLSAGILTGLNQIGGDFSGVKRIMVLTDGQANAGVISTEGLIDIVAKRDKACTMSFFGYGTDCNNDLLASLAKAGEGNHYFIETSNDIANLFAKELGGIVSCKAQSIEVLVKPNKGGEVIEVLNDYTVEQHGINALVKAEDIYVNETKHILLKIKVSKPDGKIKDRAFSVAHVEVSYDDIDAKKRVTSTHNVKVEFVKDADADVKAILAVTEQVAILTAAKAQIAASKAAQAGDFKLAKQFFTSGSLSLAEAAADGSMLAMNAQTYYAASADVVDQKTYSLNSSVSMSNSAKSATRGRATTKGLSSLYLSKQQDEMVNNFSEPETLDGNTIVPGLAAPSLPTPIKIISNIVPAVPVIPVEEPKGFSKKRSRN